MELSFLIILSAIFEIRLEETKKASISIYIMNSVGLSALNKSNNMWRMSPISGTKDE